MSFNNLDMSKLELIQNHWSMQLEPRNWAATPHPASSSQAPHNPFGSTVSWSQGSYAWLSGAQRCPAQSRFLFGDVWNQICLGECINLYIMYIYYIIYIYMCIININIIKKCCCLMFHGSLSHLTQVHVWFYRACCASLRRLSGLL